ncbi:MAG: ComEC family competence protein, partial [Bacteroidales bacterium]|nr:ComEC family competence protein [Bacteroidales bacterium]
MSDRSLLVLLTSGFFLTLIMFLLSVNVPYQNEYIAGLLIFIDMIILGICLQVHDNRPFYNYSRHGLDSQSTVLRVISSPEERPKTYRILCEIVDSGKSSPNVCLYLRRNSDYLPQYGHVISVHRALQQIEPPSEGDEFDYRRYCFNKNIGYRVFASEDDIIAVDTVPKKNFHVCVMSLRDNLLNILKSYSPDDKSYSVAAALLLGYDEIDEDTRQSFRAAGTIHVLCVSGLHVATVFMLIS